MPETAAFPGIGLISWRSIEILNFNIDNIDHFFAMDLPGRRSVRSGLSLV